MSKSLWELLVPPSSASLCLLGLQMEEFPDALGTAPTRHLLFQLPIPFQSPRSLPFLGQWQGRAGRGAGVWASSNSLPDLVPPDAPARVLG